MSDEGLDLRLTPLDPRRPAPDLLEDLLTGLDGCFLLWRESSDALEVDDAVADRDDGRDDDEDDDGEDWYALAAERFCEELRLAMHEAGSPA